MSKQLKEKNATVLEPDEVLPSEDDVRRLIHTGIYTGETSFAPHIHETRTTDEWAERVRYTKELIRRKTRS